MRGLLQRLVLLGGSLIVIGLLFEVALRIAGFSYPSFYSWSPDVGRVLRPNAAGWTTREGEAYVQINRDGFRDRERAVEKPPDVYRVAFLGDSYVEATQVAADSSVAAILERRLSECGALGPRVEVLNFGVSGYGTAQELLTLRQRVWKYRPDLVLLAVLPGNDVRNNSATLEGDEARPYFVFRNGQLELDPSFRSAQSHRPRFPALISLHEFWLDHSRLYQLGKEAYVRLGTRLEKRWPVANRAEPALEQGLDTGIYGVPSDPRWQEAWALSESLLVTMHREVLAKDSRFAFVIVGTALQDHPSEERRAAAEAEVGTVLDLDYPDRRLLELARRHAIPAIALSPRFRDYSRRTGRFLHGFGSNLGHGHWNEEGHRLAGTTVADSLCGGSWFHPRK